MHMDFKADFLEFVQVELKTLGVSPPDDDPTKCGLLLFKLQRRCPVARPRRTELSIGFTVPPHLKSGFEGLVAAIGRGDSLMPYLSRSTFKARRKDQLLDDWGILHFHLGTKMLPSGLIEGTEIVAFGIVTSDCVYFIDVHGHGHGTDPYVWVREELIHTIDDNWPQLLPTNHSHLTPDKLTSEQRANCRKKSVNVTITKSSGEVIFPPGGGVMLDGTAIADFMQLQKIYSQLEYGRKICTLNETGIRDALGISDQDFRMRMGFDNRQLFFYEHSSGTQVEFIS